MAAEDEIVYWRRMYEHVREQVDNVLTVAARGYVSPAAWNAAAGPSRDVVEWRCPACGGRQKQQGPCQMQSCVPGEVARALAKETRTSARIRKEVEAREPARCRHPSCDEAGVCHTCGQRIESFPR
jgi:hypothetical protein